MIVDLHAHYPMHVVPEARPDPLRALRSANGRARLRDRTRAALLGLASRIANHRDWRSGPRVTVPQIRDGGVRVVLSVLYSFFDEVDACAPYGAPPDAEYPSRLLGQLDAVEAKLRRDHADTVVVARRPAELDGALDGGRIAFVHCVEGGFHLGDTPEAVERALAELARRGVAYVTLAHMVWRRVATNTPGLPFLSDRLYHRLLPQPPVGLSELGRAAVRAMARERILVDVAHMSERAIAETVDLLERDGSDLPLICSHGAVRLGDQEYGLSETTLRRIAERDGVVGLILGQHRLNSGVRRTRTRTLDESFAVIRAHLDRIAEVTGSHRHSAIGSDFDGFVKPTMGGLESMRDLGALRERLVDHYGSTDGQAIGAGNALRVLRAGWGS